jgi:putative NIF3 family GTP cyclohydrolase 1 type 2
MDGIIQTGILFYPYIRRQNNLVMNQFNNDQNRHPKTWGRREFVTTLLAGVGSAALLTIPDAGYANGHPAATLTIREVIDLIIKSVPTGPLSSTVDTIKSGDPEQPVKGIVTTMFATMEVIRKTAALGANFIIAHEPTFYNHADETGWLANDDVYKYKEDLLKKNNIVVWRCHDYIHTHKPDGVFMGVITALGWEKQYDEANPNLIKLAPASLQSIIHLCKSRLGIEHLRYIGDLTQMCSSIGLLPGAAGGNRQITSIQKNKPDLLICGELNEWETSEYIRDQRAMGGKTSLIVLGHIVSEEPGLQWLLQWLRPQLNGIKITHLPSKDAFKWG